MSEWQPIETAPRDGTWIITYSPRAIKQDIRPIRMNKWKGKEWWCSNNTYWPPTHWMPLPEPPK